MSKPRTTKSSTPNPVSCFHQPPRPRELLHFHLMHKATVRQIAREAGGSNG